MIEVEYIMKALQAKLDDAEERNRELVEALEEARFHLVIEGYVSDVAAEYQVIRHIDAALAKNGGTDWSIPALEYDYQDRKKGGKP